MLTCLYWTWILVCQKEQTKADYIAKSILVIMAIGIVASLGSVTFTCKQIIDLLVGVPIEMICLSIPAPLMYSMCLQ